MQGYNTPVCFTIGGQAGVPTSGIGVLLTVTATAYSISGWITLFPDGSAIPPTSNLNLTLSNARSPRHQAIASPREGDETLCGRV